MYPQIKNPAEAGYIMGEGEHPLFFGFHLVTEQIRTQALTHTHTRHKEINKEITMKNQQSLTSTFNDCQLFNNHQ